MLCGQYKNQHMLVGSACTLLSIIIFDIIITTERELDQNTCGEGVDTAERGGKSLCDDVNVCA